jgi:hypothetical protein
METDLIDFDKTKELLRQAIQALGYGIDREKSCKQWLVFRKDGDKVIVPLKSDYKLFFNPNIPADRGDTIDFLLHRLNGGGVDTSTSRTGNMLRLKQQLQHVAGYVPTTPAVVVATAEKTSYRYDIQPMVTITFSVAQLLRRRGINPDLLKAPDIAEEVGLLHAGNGYVNLFFHWKDEQGKRVGGQYKYLSPTTGGTAKAFVAGTTRYNSVWSTDLKGKSGLLICEDPLDALSYQQLYPGKNYALLATGGAISAEQIRIIKNKAQQAHVPIVLGNDNDIAGQISNLKIIDATAKVVSIDTKNQAAVVILDGKEQVKVSCKDLENYIQRSAAAHPGSYILEVPKQKDWNDDLRSIPQKAVPSAALQAVINRTAIAENEHQQPKNSLRL